MGIVKKNKLHNPQIITDAPPSTITESDIGRLWVDKTNNTISIALGNTTTGIPELRNLLDSNDLATIDGGYYRGISEEFADIIKVPNFCNSNTTGLNAGQYEVRSRVGSHD